MKNLFRFFAIIMIIMIGFASLGVAGTLASFSVMTGSNLLIAFAVVVLAVGIFNFSRRMRSKPYIASRIANDITDALQGELGELIIDPEMIFQDKRYRTLVAKEMANAIDTGGLNVKLTNEVTQPLSRGLSRLTNEVVLLDPSGATRSNPQVQRALRGETELIALSGGGVAVIIYNPNELRISSSSKIGSSVNVALNLVKHLLMTAILESSPNQLKVDTFVRTTPIDFSWPGVDADDNTTVKVPGVFCTLRVNNNATYKGGSVNIRVDGQDTAGLSQTYNMTMELIGPEVVSTEFSLLFFQKAATEGTWKPLSLVVSNVEDFESDLTFNIVGTIGEAGLTIEPLNDSIQLVKKLLQI